VHKVSNVFSSSKIENREKEREIRKANRNVSRRRSFARNGLTLRRARARTKEQVTHAYHRQEQDLTQNEMAE